MTSEQPPDHDPTRPTIDDLGRSAGASLRRTAPEGSIERVVATGRRRQRRQLAIGAAGAVALIGGVVLVTTRGDDADSVTRTVDQPSDTTTPVSATTAPPATTPTTSPSAETTTTEAPPTTVTLSAETRWALDYTGGTAGAAIGDPVRIGVAQYGDASVSTKAAEAAAAFVNAELGGVDGRPVELDICYLGAGERGADCGARFAADDMLAGVLGGADSQQFLDAFGDSVPGINGALNTAPDQISYVPSFVGNGIAVSMIVAEEVPAGSKVAVVGGLGGAEDRLAAFDVVDLPGVNGTTDEIVAQLVAGGAADAAAVTIFGDPACAPIQAALDQMGSDAVIVSATCHDRAEGAYYVDVPLNPDDPAAETGAQMALAKAPEYGWRALDAALSPRDPVFRFSLEQFGDLLTMVKVLNSLDGDYVPASVRQALLDFTGPAIFTGPQDCSLMSRTTTSAWSCAATLSLLQVRDGKFVTLDPIDIR